MLNRARSRTPRKKITKILVGAGAFIAAVLLATQIADIVTDRNVRYTPDYERIDLKTVVGAAGGALSEDAYRTLLWQTGLGKDAADAVLRSSGGALETLEAYQDDFFAAKEYKCEKIGIITKEERFRDADGSVARGFTPADVRDGDILITKATHSFGWRHGHAAIVADARLGETVEAITFGAPSKIQPVSKWRTYPTFIQLRVKDQELAAAAAAYAKEHLIGVEYGLFAGLLPGRGEEVPSTQCADLPWIAYQRVGIDISRGGWPVTPKKIANADNLEIVQIYGVDPDAIWK